MQSKAKMVNRQRGVDLRFTHVRRPSELWWWWWSSMTVKERSVQTVERGWRTVVWKGGRWPCGCSHNLRGFLWILSTSFWNVKWISTLHLPLTLQLLSYNSHHFADEVLSRYPPQYPSLSRTPFCSCPVPNTVSQISAKLYPLIGLYVGHHIVHTNGVWGIWTVICLHIFTVFYEPKQIAIYWTKILCTD
jgi:hypothetical protein